MSCVCFWCLRKAWNSDSKDLLRRILPFHTLRLERGIILVSSPFPSLKYFSLILREVLVGVRCVGGGPLLSSLSQSIVVWHVPSQFPPMEMSLPFFAHFTLVTLVV